MKLGIMQPYLFPYLGYFQLLSYADKFVVYDDVAYIKQGWINRNRILVNGGEYRFTVPLRKASSFKRINETQVDSDSYARWLGRFLMTVEQSYRRAPCFDPVRELLKVVFEGFEGSIAMLALRSIVATAGYLDLQTPIVESACAYGNDGLAGGRTDHRPVQEGGRGRVHQPHWRAMLVSAPRLFRARDRPQLHPLATCLVFSVRGHFIPGLSIIDVMMFHAPERIRELLREFDLV